MWCECVNPCEQVEDLVLIIRSLDRRRVDEVRDLARIIQRAETNADKWYIVRIDEL